MNIDNNIGGAPYQSRSQPIEKVQTDAAVSEVSLPAFSGSTISFVNALQAGSLASVLWTVNRDAVKEAAAASSTVSSVPAEDADAAWVYQAYTEH
ncbi:hypothetical protein QE369_004764 [Agrobacterium larrymoorei]|uniref:Uncharacterized protein n=1 Tax=Agrobacterium larrymoorei TaxID=160699 RepID=A0AAJ2BGH9_9HYPH|nr:hypothetical protein [Agrobacterium larrymoorei]MDR6104567.1 hypothetical protein [Agrobacterium larrymoorei]